MKFISAKTLNLAKGMLLLFLATALPACQSSENSVAGEPAKREIASQDPAVTPAPAEERVCTVDNFRQPDAPAAQKVDVLFVMDNSESMNRHWMLMADKIDRLIKEYPAGSDLRFAVVLGTVEKYYGRLYSGKNVPVVLDGTKLTTKQISSYLRRTFTEALAYTDRTGAGEALFYSLYYAATSRAKEIQSQGFFRPDAGLQVMFMSDDAEIGTKYPSRQPWNLPPKCNYTHHESVRKSHYLPRGISTDTTFQALRRLKGQMPLTTNAFVNITKEDILVDNSMSAKCIFDSPGYGYFDMVKKTDGILYSIHHDRAEGLARTGRLMASRLDLIHDFKLSKPAEKVDAATIEAKVDGALKTHAYSALTNTVHLAEAGQAGSQIAIRHCEPIRRQEWSLVGFAGEASRTEAQLRWQTPELATFGRVLFGTDREQLTGSAESVRGTSHAVNVTGLQPNTLYYFQAISWDETGVEKRSEVISLTTQPDWQMGGLTGESSRSSASLQWGTTYPTKGRVFWGWSPDQLTNSTEETASGETHQVVVNGLEPNTVYYFQAVSHDSFGLEKWSDVVELRTVADWTIMGFAGEAGRTGAALRWETPDYPTAGRVVYGFSPDSMDQSVESSVVGNSHRVDVTGLIPSTIYYFQVVGRDNLGAVKRSQVIALETKADWIISEAAGLATETTLAFSFRTIGYPTNGKVLWGLAADSLTEEAAAGSGTEHSVELTNLAPDTIYYVQAVAGDDLGVEKRGEVLAFRTKAEVPPLPVWSIGSLEGTPATRAVTLEWQTSAYATAGQVLYGTNPDQLDGTVNSIGTKKDHSVEVTGLQPDTLYYFQVLAWDDRGQEQFSAVIPVHTLAEDTVPVPEWKIQGFDGTTTANGATLIWQTPGALTKATVRVGLSATDFSFKTVEVTEWKNVHLTEVTGLAPETTYYFQVTATDQAGGSQQSTALMKRTKAQ
jgi:phosphodiesterase/alkaline phosphatase D-like protein